MTHYITRNMPKSQLNYVGKKDTWSVIYAVSMAGVWSRAMFVCVCVCVCVCVMCVWFFFFFFFFFLGGGVGGGNKLSSRVKYVDKRNTFTFLWNSNMLSITKYSRHNYLIIVGNNPPWRHGTYPIVNDMVVLAKHYGLGTISVRQGYQ